MEAADKTVCIWNMATMQRERCLIGHDAGISDVCWSCDSNYICTASDDTTIRIWSAQSVCVHTCLCLFVWSFFVSDVLLVVFIDLLFHLYLYLFLLVICYFAIWIVHHEFLCMLYIIFHFAADDICIYYTLQPNKGFHIKSVTRAYKLCNVCML